MHLKYFFSFFFFCVCVCVCVFLVYIRGLEGSLKVAVEVSCDVTPDLAAYQTDLETRDT